MQYETFEKQFRPLRIFESSLLLPCFGSAQQAQRQLSDLAQSLFSQQRNLVLEGLTDYWYLEAVSHLLRAADFSKLK